MKTRGIWFCGGALAITVLLSLLVGTEKSRKEGPPSPGIGDAKALQASYERWKAQYARTGGDRKLVLALGYSKGLSARFTKAHGHLTLDLTDGSLRVEVQGLSDTEAFDVWVINNRPGPGQSVKPEPGDGMLRIGNLKPEGKAATLETRLERARLTDFKLDLVVVTRAAETPVDGGLLFGSPTLFQRIYYSEQRGQLAAFSDRATGRPADLRVASLLSAPFRALIPSPAYAQPATVETVLEALVAQGEALFFEETFAGNGRTCGTCHPASNNLTIDPTFIATLPNNDPLFVAEFTPALKKNFENPQLMREFGLILENVDGFDDLENRFVMRGVPHTLALLTSMTPAPPIFAGATVAIDGTTLPPVGPAQRTGWGGDGAPGSGALRDFATGAVRQHFTKTLSRVSGVDFRLPTPAELDAMEAFQLSLGRQEEVNIGDTSTTFLKGLAPEAGRLLFLSSAKCNLCHFNAGANVSLGPGSLVNFNFDTGVEDFAPHPAEAIRPRQPMPRDGGFGQTPNGDGNGGLGNGSFSTPPLIEAADSGPFFHNNRVSTIEEAVDFYNSTAFNNTPSGQFVGGIELSEVEVAAVASFLRVLNALENIRSSTALAERAKAAGNYKKLLLQSKHEVEHAMRVLDGAGLHPEAVADLHAAKKLLGEASQTRNQAQRNALITDALALAAIARELMIF